MPELKNAKHEAFVQEYVKDGNGARAYRDVYGEDVKGAAQSAKHVLGLDHVQARLVEVRAALAVRTGMTQEQIVEDFESVYVKGMANPERGGLAAAHQAKSAQAKVLGFATGKEKKPVDEMTDEEFVEQVRTSSPFGPRLANLYAEVFRLGLAESMGKDISADLDKVETALRVAVTSVPGNGEDRENLY